MGVKQFVSPGAGAALEVFDQSSSSKLKNKKASQVDADTEIRMLI